MECRSADACKNEKKDIENPVIRIPEHVPGTSREEESIAEAGNPDIRVPDSLKSIDGLRARRALETENAENEEKEGDAENGDKTRGRDEHCCRGRRTPIWEIPQWDKKVPRSVNTATSQEGRG
ncbi:hypothetical protein NDU88_003705 [Pleurodeles waltl]|uniref:Uncharacterized protein n=1 Tax=Pleurodeles waltl TaxID=8319 RepID=A0AAV7VEY8_PLEWA|nr:hypothetical protein NDU88_003705 [Pleurodeles waltl]